MQRNVSRAAPQEESARAAAAHARQAANLHRVGHEAFMVVLAAALVSLVIRVLSGGTWQDSFGEGLLLAVGIMYYAVRSITVQWGRASARPAQWSWFSQGKAAALGIAGGLLLAVAYGLRNALVAETSPQLTAFFSAFILVLLIYIPVFLLGWQSVARIQAALDQRQPRTPEHDATAPDGSGERPPSRPGS